MAAKKKPAKKAPAKAGVAKPKSLLRVLDQASKGSERSELFGAVSERVKTCLLTEDEAALISGWFEQLAEGKEPKKVFFGETRGRKRSANTVRYVKGQDLSLPDHVDLVWSLRQWIVRTGDANKIFELCAKHFQCSREYIKKLYDKIEPTLAHDSEPGK